MIKNLWNVVKVVCGNHGNNTPDMELTHHTQKVLQYSCTCPDCRNSITVDDYDNVIKKISDEIETAEMEGDNVNLKNMRWKKRYIDYRVICFKEDKIVVTAINKKTI